MNTGKLAEFLTRALVAVESGPSPCTGEARAADTLERWARALQGAPLRIHSRKLARDACGRRNLLLVLPGSGPRHVLFAGHLDTVGTEDLGPLRPMALRPGALERARPLGPGWMQGRGTLDMKSGIGAAAAALLDLAEIPRRARGGDVALLATADEENLSAGAQSCKGWAPLTGRSWDAVLSTDFTGPPPRGSAGLAYMGTVGKALVGLLLRTSPAHAGAPDRGPDAARWAAETIRLFTRREFSAFTPAPAVLRARDLKGGYDTQLPHGFVVFFNVLGYPLEPSRVAASLCADVASAWRECGRPASPGTLASRGTRQRAAAGVPPVAVWRRGPSAAPSPGRSPGHSIEPWDLALEAVLASSPPSPGATIFFAPPYYASRAAERTPAARALRAVARREGLSMEDCYPYISDLSLFGAADDARSREWRARCPIAAPPSGIGLKACLATFGPWGRGAHQPDEAVRTDYAFGRLPGILEECVKELWK